MNTHLNYCINLRNMSPSGIIFPRHWTLAKTWHRKYKGTNITITLHQHYHCWRMFTHDHHVSLTTHRIWLTSRNWSQWGSAQWKAYRWPHAELSATSKVSLKLKLTKSKRLLENCWWDNRLGFRFLQLFETINCDGVENYFVFWCSFTLVYHAAFSFMCCRNDFTQYIQKCKTNTKHFQQRGRTSMWNTKTFALVQYLTKE